MLKKFVYDYQRSAKLRAYVIKCILVTILQILVYSFLPNIIDGRKLINENTLLKVVLISIIVVISNTFIYIRLWKTKYKD